MLKGNVYKGLIIVVVVCLSLVFVGMCLNVTLKNKIVESSFSELVFPLDVDLSGMVFSVGDSLSVTATITNVSGKNVVVVSNGYMPCVYLCNVFDTRSHPEPDSISREMLKSNGKLSRDFVFEFTECGVYVLYVHYGIEVNGVWLSSELDDIIIEVK